MTTLELTTDPAAFLGAAGPYLAADPLVASVVATTAERRLREEADGAVRPADDWWLTVRGDDGAVVGAGMRSARLELRPAFLLPMPDDAALALARELHGRGEEMLAVNGALPTVEVCATELARLTGTRVEVAMRSRLHVYDEPRDPRPVPGSLAEATEDDLDLVAAWMGAFLGDADEQAGRPRGAGHGNLDVDLDDVRRRIRERRIWLWRDDAGTPVHLTGANLPSYGAVRVGPVYTPPSQRGRGWASSAVAAVSRLLAARGDRVILYTDQANPTSNKIYADVGYVPVVDMANLVLVA